MTVRFVLSALILLLGVNVAHAHFIFLETDGTHIDMRFSERPLEETDERLQKLAAPMEVKAAEGDIIPFTSGEEALVADVDEGSAGLIHGSLDYGVLDRTAQDRGVFMLVYHAKGAKSAAEAGTKVGLPVEVVAKVEGDDLQITVLQDGKPASAAEVTVAQEGHEEELEFDTGESGTVTAPLGTEGVVGIRAMVRVDGAGEHDGEAYEFSRVYSTLTFRP